MKRFILYFTGLFFSASVFSYTPTPFNFHNYSVKHERTTLPTSYDSRDYDIILPAKDQGRTNCCWAYTACHVAQAKFYKENSKSGDLAPIVYVNCAKDLGFNYVDVNSGGNEGIANAMNCMLKTPVYQNRVPELTINTTECPKYTKDDIHKYILSSSDLPENDAIAIKKAIMEHGSVFSSVHYDDNYYSKSNNFYEYTGENEPNHAISIIGWDDNKQAWLVKNTWGTYWGDEGCFWVSYDDSQISKKCTSWNEFVDTEDIDEVYTYSKSNCTGSMGYEKPNIPLSILVAYEIKKGESLEYISTFIVNPDTKIQIAISYDGENEPIYTWESENIKYTGMYLHKLNEEIVSNGEAILVEICYTSPYKYAVPTEQSIENYNDITLYDNQWISLNGEWVPVGKDSRDFRYNFVVYVYTKKQKSTTNLEENSALNNKVVFSDGKINPEIWESAIQATIFDVSGRNYGTIKPGGNIPTLNKGYYVLIIDMKDDTFVVEKFNIF